ncbi:M23 family metallopeptidase [Nocardioides caricicola]|uniref:M23 family metallopeptidase n=1 Tax=Nocardioides caricicola TaxID=634770 RepID=A0ABW0MY17_9ACTN
MTTRLALLLSVLVALLLPAAAHAAAPDPVGVWPLAPEPEVVTGFDPPADPWGAGHRGVDLLGSPGQPVRSALPGTISWAGVLAGRGVVVVDHGDTRTTYEPVDATVTPGTSVGAGDRIGRLSTVGSHCLPRSCLHWGWIEGAETYLDPLRLVGAGPVRLLPLWRAQPVTARVAPSYPGWQPLVADLRARSCGSEVLAQMHICGVRGRHALPPQDLPVAVLLVEPRRLEGE